MVIHINSLANKIVKETNKLKLEKYRKENNQFLIEGFHLLEMALKSNVLLAVFTLKPLKIEDSIIQYVVTEEILNKLSFMPSNQGVIGICKMQNPKASMSNLLIYLDNIKDPGNMGTIIRTALAFNIKDILVSPNCVSIYNNKVLMASQGSIFNENITVVTYEKLKEMKKDYQIVATTLNSHSVSFETYELKQNKNIIVFGNESEGISDSIRELSDDFIKIDISNIDSLNVGVAAGIIMHKFFQIAKIG